MDQYLGKKRMVGSNTMQGRLSTFFTKIDSGSPAGLSVNGERKNKNIFSDTWDDYEDFVHFDESFLNISSDKNEDSEVKNKHGAIDGGDMKCSSVTNRIGNKEGSGEKRRSLSSSSNKSSHKKGQILPVSNCQSSFQKKCKLLLEDVDNRVNMDDLKNKDMLLEESNTLDNGQNLKKSNTLGTSGSTKPLGIDNSLSTLISNGESLLANDVHSVHSVEELANTKNLLEGLKNSVLEKICEAFDAIPCQILQNLPGFDISTYKKLKNIHLGVEQKLSALKNLNSFEKYEQSNFVCTENLKNTENSELTSTWRKINYPREYMFSTDVNQVPNDVICSRKINEKKNLKTENFATFQGCRSEKDIEQLELLSDIRNLGNVRSGNSVMKAKHIPILTNKSVSPTEYMTTCDVTPKGKTYLSLEDNEYGNLRTNKSQKSHEMFQNLCTNEKLQLVDIESPSDLKIPESKLNSIFTSAEMSSGSAVNDVFKSKYINDTLSKNNEMNISRPECTPPTSVEMDITNNSPKTGSNKFTFKKPSLHGKSPVPNSHCITSQTSKRCENTLIDAGHHSTTDTFHKVKSAIINTSPTALPSKGIVNKLATSLFKQAGYISKEQSPNGEVSTLRHPHELRRDSKSRATVSNFEIQGSIDYPEDEILENYNIEPASPEKNCVNISVSPRKINESRLANKSAHSNHSIHSKFDATTTKARNKTVEEFSTLNENYVGKFSSKTRNDGVSGEFDGTNFPHSVEMFKVFRDTFGLHSFRPCQLQAVNAILMGHDCFILMPTGGGKSLCYQLPAVIGSGVTIVVSPLKSLILDQVQKLEALDIPAARLSGEIKEENEVYAHLSIREPRLKLLYVTPEKLVASDRCVEAIHNLYARGKLVRIVIDEVHCVSQWGHDFRPDYKKLNVLRQKYPDIPIVALTATASERVRLDVLHQLQIKKPKWFICSFNRPNLQYEVVAKKPKNAVNDIITLIKHKFARDCGIVYCLSQKECEITSNCLNNAGIKAGIYHAGLPDTERARVQKMWVCNKIKVVCATIAFGMGIDKPDVRYVIHQSMPKSVEGLYQESGRAGRDGKPAKCILFYNYSDTYRLRRLIERGSENTGRNRGRGQQVTNSDAKSTHFENLARIIAYCENIKECRRVQQLRYFGEIYDKKDCTKQQITTCDNCLEPGEFIETNFTKEAKEIVCCINQLSGDRRSWSDRNITILHLADIIKGSLSSKVKTSGHDSLSLHGLGKAWHREDITNLIHKLVYDGYLREELVVTKSDMTAAYLRTGPKANLLLQNNHQITMPTRKRSVSAVNNKSTVCSENPFTERLQSIQEKCYADLMDVCHGIAASLGVGAGSVMNVQAIKAMSESLPDTTEAMLQIPHVTIANFDKFGKPLLEVTTQYAVEKLVTLAEQAEFEYQNNPIGNSSNNNDNSNNTGETGNSDGEDSVSYGPSTFRGGNKRKRKGASLRGRPTKRRQNKAGKSNKRGNSSTSRASQGSSNSSSYTTGINTSFPGKRGRGRGHGFASSKAPGFMTLSVPSKLPSKRPSFLPQPKVFTL